MDKLKALLQKLGIELTADQTKQIDEVMSKEFISAEAAAADKTHHRRISRRSTVERCRISADAGTQ